MTEMEKRVEIWAFILVMTAPPPDLKVTKAKRKKKQEKKNKRKKKTSLAEFRQQMRSGDLLVYLVFLLIQTENLIIQNAYVTNKETDRRTVQPTDRETDKPSFKDTKGN